MRTSTATPTAVHPHHDDLPRPRVAGAHAPGMSQARMVQIEQDILGRNDALAADNRKRFAECGILALNLVSSPGSGKTTLLVKTIEALKDRHEVVVIEGRPGNEPTTPIGSAPPAPEAFRSTPARVATRCRHGG
jgi:hypothetical protein